MNDLISRQSAIDILNKCYAGIKLVYDRPRNCYEEMFYTRLKTAFVSAQPEPCIPLSWIEAKIDWLISLDNDLSILVAGYIKTLVNMWKDEQKAGDEMTKDDALRMLETMHTLVSLLFVYSNNIEPSVCDKLDEIQSAINDLYYHVKDGD